RSRLMGEHGIEKDDIAGCREFSRLMNQRCHENKNLHEASYTLIRKNWKFGAQDFVERLQEKITVFPKKENHITIECNETTEALGRRLIREKLEELKIQLDTLESLPRTHPIKIEIAALLRSQTTLSIKWIAHELKAGAPRTLAVALYRNKKNNYSNG
ncbi:MAG TPA: hypothetical protein VJK54_02575, partial [Chthoniobacterales bacterium]|nr:hypothetical protein [Chthoniobacterales bacterium]